MANYRASLSRSPGREGWSIIFRHPVRTDPTGKPGRRVRRGLSTSDEQEGRRLVAQMNELLGDRSLWEVSARPLAEKRYEPLIVDIFYDQVVPQEMDAFALRDSLIPLPSSQDSDYRRVQLLGTTGSGKTTLVRQFLGTDPLTERFPSTSTAKTTVADTEVLLDDGAYRAVVTFFPRDMVRDHVEECILAAALAAYKGDPERVVMRKLLNHVDQRFRFNYILGNGGNAPTDDDEEGDLFEDEDQLVIDLGSTNDFLQAAVSLLRNVAQQHTKRLRQDLSATNDDERVIEELFEENLDELLREDEDVQGLADAYMDEIEERFDALASGSVEKTKQGWPRIWSLETKPESREEFIKAVSRFSSNYVRYFGTLLTPLVNGIRVAGPFKPVWIGEHQPKVVLFDGEGLGHTPDSSASVPTSITRRFDEVDAILLVDNAAQPMQAAALAVARHLAATGKGAKLLMCFTHFDLVKGANLQGVQDKQDHVRASVEKALSFVGSELGPFAERILRKRLATGCFFVGGIDQALDDSSKRAQRTIEQLGGLLAAIDHIVERPLAVAAKPVYDRMNLVLAVKKAVENFHDAWEARLGRASKPGISKEHWTRVKALSRRFAENWADEYDTLRPVADLHKELYEAIYVFIQNPVEWIGVLPNDDEKQHRFDTFAEAISTRALAVARRRLAQERIPDWQRAFSKSGTGSTFVRAAIIADDVYGQAAPVPAIAPTPDRNRFLHEIVEVVMESAHHCEVELR
jgi:hypothetical protein